MTFPNACVFARENMRPVLSGECPGLGQKAHHCFEVGDVQSATLAELIRLLETTGVINCVFHASNYAIKSQQRRKVMFNTMQE